MNGRGEAPGLAGHRRPGGGAMDGFPTPRAPEPYLVAINLTRRCNLRCRHCYLDAGSRREGQDQELTTAELIALFEEIAGRARETLVVLSGGEPLLREDIHVLISTGNTAGLRMVLGTNGLLMDTEVAARLKQAGLEGVGISLDSLSPLEHDGFRGVPGAWRRAVTAIEACRAVELHVQLHTTLTRQNVAQIPSFVGLAQDLDVAMVNFFFLICTGRGQSLSDLTPQEYESALQAIARVQAKMAFPMIQARCAPHFKRILYQMDPASPFTRAQGYDGGGCLAATRYCRVDPTGNVTPCPYLKSVAGNLRRASFWTIWDQSPLLAELRRPTRGGRCGRCEFAALCGGCRARALARHGSLTAEDPSCLWEPVPGAPAVRFPAKTPPAGTLWTPEARKRLERVPGFLREMVRKRLEERAIAEKVTITPELMAAYRKEREQELGLRFSNTGHFKKREMGNPAAPQGDGPHGPSRRG